MNQELRITRSFIFRASCFISIVYLVFFWVPPAVWGATRAQCEADCATQADNCQRDGRQTPDYCSNLRATCTNSCATAPSTPQQLQFLQRVGQAGGYRQATELSVAQITGRLIYGTLGLLGVIFLVLTVYAGFLWLTAGGDEEKVRKAQGYIKNGVIGIAVVLAAFSITAFVLRLLIGSTLLPVGGGQRQVVPEEYQVVPE